MCSGWSTSSGLESRARDRRASADATMTPTLTYFARLPAGKAALWCYLIWYLVTVFNHFDPAPSIWLNSIGISVVIGLALSLSVGPLRATFANRWQAFRLFMMPFAVSSFSALIKGRGFVLVFPPDAGELAASIGACAGFLLFVAMLRALYRRRAAG